MFAQIKRLGADTAIYGISTIVGRLLNFLLVPLYTNVLLPAEYGIVATVYSYIAFFAIFYSYGMESAYFRFASGKEIGDEKDNFSTPFLSIAVSAILFSIIFMFFASPATHLFQITESYISLIYYTAGILLFDSLAIIPFAALRLDRKAKQFAAFKIVNIVSNVILNILTVIVWRWGIEGIFFSNLISSALTFCLLIPLIRQKYRFQFNKLLYSELLKFGLPIIPVGISGILLNIADRPILKMLMDDASVGVYQANYRLGIFMNLVIGMFEYAWRPFFLSHAKDPDAKKLFARVMTYFLFFCSIIFLIITFFINDIIHFEFYGRHLIHSRYWGGLDVVPWILLGYIFSGIGTNLNAGIQIEKKTIYLLPTSLSGSVTNIVLNFLLIPVFGIMGAAYATTIGYAMVAITLYFVVQRFYYIEYEFTRIGKLVITVIVAVVTAKLFFESISIKILILLIWFISLAVIGFFESGELQRIKNLFGKKS